MRRAAALGLALFAWGCGSKGSVAVTGDLEKPSAMVSNPNLIAWTLNGGCTLHIELGQYAPSGTDVSIPGALSLVKPSTQATLVVLKALAMPKPPFHLEPGGKFDADLIFADMTTPGQTITQPESDAICAAKTVQITGTLSDTASGNATPVSSATFDVTGCP